jgi:hypothetical protein
VSFGLACEHDRRESDVQGTHRSQFLHSPGLPGVALQLRVSFFPIQVARLKASTVNSIASAIALVALVGSVTFAAAIFSSGRDFLIAATAGNLVCTLTALAAWSGALWGGVELTMTCRAWIEFFFATAIISAVCVVIDIAIVHPGISLVFTSGALALSFIALPSALRAWLLDRLSRQN